MIRVLALTAALAFAGAASAQDPHAGHTMPAQAAAPAAATVGVALPRLAPGTWTAAWTAEGPDGHKMSGSISFMVH